MSGSRIRASASATVESGDITTMSGVINAPAVPSACDNNWRIVSASSSSMASSTLLRCSPGICTNRSAKSSYSISSNTLVRRSISRPSIKRNCSSSGNSSNTSAKRSSSIASATSRRCSSGSARIIAATSLGCMSRKRAASAACAVVGANKLATTSQSISR